MLDSIRTGLMSLWSNKVRSVLNILGVVIGVASVTILVSLGEGLKSDVSGLIKDFGTNLIVVTGGKFDDDQFSQGGSNPASFISGDIISLSDVEKLQVLPELKAISPVSLVPGNLKYGEKTSVPTLFGSYPNLLESLEIIKLDRGQMFTANDPGHVIVLGPNAVKSLFDGADPIGKEVMIGKEKLTVIGTIKSGKSSSFVGSEFDAFSIIPFDMATQLNKDKVTIYRLYGRAVDGADVKKVKEKVRQTITDNHNGEEDFTVLTQDDILGLFDMFLSLATTMVSAIASISLVVGGIGIMNIMLVTVTERTREIGIRKAVGATKWAILTQFLTEAVIVTFIGSLAGLLIAFIVGLVVAARTDLNPLITPELILLAVGIAIGIGIIFGLWPALRAANKDPIEALRYE